MIWGLDLGIRTGYAFGLPGETPTSGVCELKKRGEPIDVAFSNLIAFLVKHWRVNKPFLVACEAQLPLKALNKKNAREATIEAHYGYHAIVRGMCGRYGIRYVAANNAKVRKHFIGRSNAGTRETTKDFVVIRCHQLGLMPRTAYDHDRGDALATFHWACSEYKIEQRLKKAG